MNVREFRLAKNELKQIAADACKKAVETAIDNHKYFLETNPIGTKDLADSFEKAFGVGFVKFMSIQAKVKKGNHLAAYALAVYKDGSQIVFCDPDDSSNRNYSVVMYNAQMLALDKTLQKDIKRAIDDCSKRNKRLNDLLATKRMADDRVKNFDKMFSSAMKTVEFNILASSSEGISMSAMLKSMSKMLGEALGVKIG